MLKSLRLSLLNQALRHTLQPVFTIEQPSAASLLEARRQFQRLTYLMPCFHRCNIHDSQAPGLNGEWIEPAYYSQRVIFYLHGGGFYVGSPRSHRPLTTALATLSQSRVFCLDYGLAPENRIFDIQEETVTAYKALIASGHLPHQIVFAGDSAGGHLVLTTLLRLRDLQLPQPAAAILLSPWTDLSCSLPSHQRLADKETVLNAEFIHKLGKFLTQGQEIQHPLLSPVNAEFTGLPPLLFHVSDQEILLDDSVFCVEKARSQQVKVELKIWPQMPHVFQVFPLVLPEARRAMEDMVRFMDIY